MAMVSTWMVLIWLLPLLMQIVAPLIILVIWLVIRGGVLLLAGIAGERHQRTSPAEKRAHRRVNANDVQVTITSGSELIHGLACNISRMGICIMGLPRAIGERAHALSVVVDNGEDSYSLHITPRWHQNHESGGQIGAAIEYAPAGWHEFVRKSGSFAAV